MTFYEILVIVSLVLWIVLSLGAIISMVALLPRISKGMRQLEVMADEFEKKAFPVIEQSQQLLDQVGAVTTSLVDDVERIDRTVIRAPTSVESMVELAEDRGSEITAPVEVADDEAEEPFISTAAIRRALRLGGRARKRRRAPRA